MINSGEFCNKSAMFSQSNQRFPLSGGLMLLTFGGLATLAAPCHGQTLYNFGNPTAEEQQYLELINRARANPPAEGARLAATTDPDVTSAYTQFGVNLVLMQSEFNAITAQAPLAPNASLTTSARGHSAWMLANAVQSHDETNPSNTPFTRMTNAGYTYSTAGENIFAYSRSVWHGHAGFQVDWGTGTGGMQSPRGHRANIHNGAFREIGVGVALGTNGAVGPQLVTQDFGTQTTNPTLGTGVAYYDLNANNFYDLGEGISGLTVNVSGASYYCTTGIGGGWVVPVPNAAATRTVTFSGLNVNQTASLAFPASTNAKADLKLTYTPPSITSTASATTGNLHTLAFTAVGGASAYHWNRWNIATAAAENCDSTTNITSSTTAGYTVLNTTLKQEGAASFHLVNSTGLASQWLQLSPLYYGQASPSLSFQSRIRYATTSEHFKVQVREEGGSVWQDVFSQAGTTASGESSFNLRSPALTGMAGKAFRIRFLLDPGNGSHYSGTDDNYGWFIDAISFAGVSALQSNVTQTLAGTSGSFTPGIGTYLMSVAPVISNLDFPASYQTLTVSAAPPPSFATWAANLESVNSLAAGSISNPAADPDQDGRSNLVEYAFGTSPVIGNDPAPRMPAAQTTATDFVLQYQRDTALTDLTFTAQACTDLGDWKAPGELGVPTGFTDILISTTGTLQTRQAKIPLSSGNTFMRVRITRP